MGQFGNGFDFPYSYGGLQLTGAGPPSYGWGEINSTQCADALAGDFNLTCPILTEEYNACCDYCEGPPPGTTAFTNIVCDPNPEASINGYFTADLISAAGVPGYNGYSGMPITHADCMELASSLTCNLLVDDYAVCGGMCLGCAQSTMNATDGTIDTCVDSDTFDAGFGPCWTYDPLMQHNYDWCALDYDGTGSGATARAGRGRDVVPMGFRRVLERGYNC